MPPCPVPSSEAQDRWRGRLFLLGSNRQLCRASGELARSYLGLAASRVDRNHGGKSCPSQASNRIEAEGRVFPHTGADARLCEFHYDSRNAADEKRERVLEHAPRY